MATDTLDQGIRKNSSETIRVRPVTFNGRQLLDVRAHVETATGEAAPTRKGLTLRAETWRELLPAIAAALEGMADGTAEADA